MYVDNATTASPIQPDWLTLEFLNEPVTLGYSTGAQLTIKVGDISLDFSMPAEGYRKSGGIVYPTDASGSVILNAETTPRLAGMRRYLHEEIAKRSEERVRIAEIVHSFTDIINLYGSAI